MASERRRAQLAELTALVSILPFAEAEARAAAGIRAVLERTGLSIGPLDTLIAGTALRHGAVLVTHNVREFGRIEGLNLEDWY